LDVPEVRLSGKKEKERHGCYLNYWGFSHDPCWLKETYLGYSGSIWVFRLTFQCSRYDI